MTCRLYRTENQGEKRTAEQQADSGHKAGEYRHGQQAPD